MEINDFENRYDALAHLNHQVGLWRLSAKDIAKGESVALSVKMIIVVTHGGMCLRVGERDCVISAPAFADLSGSSSAVRLLSASDDVEGFVFLFTSEYLVRLFRNHPPFSIDYVSFIQSHPVCRLPQNVAMLFTDAMESLWRTLLDTDNINRRRLTDSKVKILYMEIENYFEHVRQLPSAADVGFTDRRMELFTMFVEKLRLYAKSRHTVEFFASAVSVTPQYLNRIVRDISGRTASAMIADAVLGEAKRLLESTDAPLQHVALEMDFADQSSFTKFFKRLAGITPLEYRNGRPTPIPSLGRGDFRDE
ncbi:MAG: helix-turn-helix domain-containing protein [Prevotella sp.]